MIKNYIYSTRQLNDPPKMVYRSTKKIADDYREEQKQQYARRQAEKFDRLAEFSLDDENKKKYKSKANEWLGQEQILSEQASMITKKDVGEAWRVNADYINTKAYHDKFEKLDVPSTVKENTYKETIRLLDSVDGIEDEHMIALNARTGDFLVDNLKRKGKATKTSFTSEEYEKIKDCKEKIILIHNHSHNVRPSGTDIVTVAKNEKISKSIIACHDGDVYLIRSVKKEVAQIYQETYNELRKTFDEDIAKLLATNKLYNANETRHLFKVERL